MTISITGSFIAIMAFAIIGVILSVGLIKILSERYNGPKDERITAQVLGFVGKYLDKLIELIKEYI